MSVTNTFAYSAPWGADDFTRTEACAWGESHAYSPVPAPERPRTCRANHLEGEEFHTGAITGHLVFRAGGRPRDLSPVPSALTQYSSCKPFQRYQRDPSTEREDHAPSGVQTGYASWPGKVNCVSVSRAHSYSPEVTLLATEDLERQFLAVRREPRIRPVGVRRAQHRRLAVARQPVDRTSRRGRARVTTSVPSDDTASCAPPSAGFVAMPPNTGPAGPTVSRRVESKRTAKSVPCRR